VGGDVVEHPVGVEGRLEQHAGAGREPGHHRVVAEHARQRQRAQDHVALTEPEHRGVGHGVGQDRGPGVRGELGQARRARGGERDRERPGVRALRLGPVVAPGRPGARADVGVPEVGCRSAGAGDDGDLGHDARALDGRAQALAEVQPVEALGQRDQPRPGAGEEVRGLLDAVAGVDADDVRAARGDRALPHQPVTPVRHPHRDRVAGAHAVHAKLLGEGPDALPELSAGHGTGDPVRGRVEHRDDVRVPAGEPAEQVREVVGHLARRGEGAHRVRGHRGGHDASRTDVSSVSQPSRTASKPSISSIG